jgi:3-hydroxy-9,10-secoandrosta-1,3,5(10)-triene-9,17-dione monooxygenase reductase component
VKAQATLVQRAVGSDAFRDALGHWATGVALVTATVDGRPEGLLVTSLTSVSLEPPLIAFSPSRASLTWARMQRAGRFGVNVLGAGADEYARQAARPGADRFGSADWAPTVAGVPALADALAFLQCRREAMHPAGDHWIVVGRVEAVRAREAAAPLLRWRGRYGTICPG